LGATGGDVTLEEWLVWPGESVQAGQPLFVVMTDKATVEVEAFREGVLRRILAEAGESLSTGAIVALLADSMEEPIDLPEAAPKVNAVTPPPHIEAKAGATPARSGDRILASPLARRMAAQNGIDLASLRGSGSGGQILKRDVESALAAKDGVESHLPVPERSPREGKRVPLSPMRRAVAERVQQSKSEIPHFDAAITIDMSAALELRTQTEKLANERGQAKPTITDLCIKAAALPGDTAERGH
jgi:pyruvate dehydrogenase E2 component (dihydrolipoamide acetyltransferase)